MMKFEFGRSRGPEVVLDKVAEQMRPHRVFDPAFQQALAVEGADLDALADTFVANLQQARGQDPYAYYYDVLKDSAEDTAAYKQGVKDFLKKLAQLPDKSFIHLDLAKDKMCQTARCGVHCGVKELIGPNGTTVNTVNSEDAAVRGIRYRLEGQGFRRGKDFFEYPTQHQLRQLSGGYVNSGLRSEIYPVTFNSLIVRTGVLRKICRTELAKAKSA